MRKNHGNEPSSSSTCPAGKCRLSRSPTKEANLQGLPLPMLTPTAFPLTGEVICRHYLTLQSSHQTGEARRRYPQLTSSLGKSLPTHQGSSLLCKHSECPCHQHRLSSGHLWLVLEPVCNQSAKRTVLYPNSPEREICVKMAHCELCSKQLRSPHWSSNFSNVTIPRVGLEKLQQVGYHLRQF